MSASTLIALALAIPAGAILLIAAAERIANLREAITLVAALALFAMVAMLTPQVLAGGHPEMTLLSVLPGLTFGFRVEPLGMLFALIASFLWIVNSVYSIGYMRANKEPRQTVFYCCFAAALASTVGIAFSANLFTLFIFYELLTLTTYPLVTHHGDREAQSAGRVYMLMLLGTSIVLLLPAIMVTFAFTGTLEFTAGGILAGGHMPAALVGVLLALFAFGIGKAAIMPFHRWLPAAMVAPTPVSALLHAVAVVKAGVFCVVKVVVYIFGVDFLAGNGGGDWLVWIAGFTVLTASVIALRQDNLKRLLAYSTISQLSYVVLAVAILTPLSAAGAALHILAHAFGKITLFFAAGAIYTAAHKTEVSQLDGIGRAMPWTMVAFAIGAASMIGIPPTAGFMSKWFILGAAMDAQSWVAIAVIIASTALNAAYFVPIVYAAFFRPLAAPEHGHHQHGEAPWPIVVALTITAAGTVLLFFFPDVGLGLARQMVGGA